MEFQEPYSYFQAVSRNNDGTWKVWKAGTLTEAKKFWDGRKPANGPGYVRQLTLLEGKGIVEAGKPWRATA